MSGNETIAVLSFFVPMLVVLVALMLASLWLVFTPLPQWAIPAWFVRAVGCFSFAICSACALYFIRLLRGSALEIDNDGIVYRFDPLAFNRIRWEEISGVRRRRLWPLRFITISVRDRRPFKKRGNLLQQAMKAMGAPVVGPISLDNLSLQANFDELFLTLSRYFDQARVGRISPR